MRIPKPGFIGRYSLLNFWIPQSALIRQHPLYRLERQRQGGIALADLSRHSLSLLAEICAVIVGFPLIVLIYTGNFGAITLAIYDIWSSMWLLVGIVAVIVLDVAGVWVSVGSINRDRPTMLWNLLRATPLLRWQIILVKHTVAQTRVWNLVIAILGMRVGVVIIGGGYWVKPLLGAFHHDPVRGIFILYMLLILMAMYILEPLWRVRAMVAVGIVISARVQDSFMSVLAGVGSIGFLWLTQGIGLLILLRFLSHSIAFDLGNGLDGSGLIMAAGLLSIYVAITYTYYNQLRLRCLHRAVKDAFRE